MSNVEGMYLVYFIKKDEQSETNLLNSAVQYSIFCGSLIGLVKFHISPVRLSYPMGERSQSGRRHKTQPISIYKNL